ncbi:MAG: hypothetical protein AB7U23_12640 [Dehalococcoidia bacterium]
MNPEIADLAKWVSQYHFGIQEHGTGKPICSTCVETPFPCKPLLLARAVAEQELAK